MRSISVRLTTGVTTIAIRAIRAGTIRIVIRNRTSLTRTRTLMRIPLIVITSPDTAPAIVTVEFASGCDNVNSLLEQRGF